MLGIFRKVRYRLQEGSLFGAILFRTLIALSKTPLTRSFHPSNMMHQPILRFFKTRLYDFVLHEAYWLVASVKYHFRGGGRTAGDRDTETENLVKQLSERGYVTIGTTDAKTLDGLKPFWTKFEVFQKDKDYGYRPPMPVLYRGMMTYPAISENLIFYHEFDEQDCSDIFNFATKTQCLEIIRRFLKSEVSAYNIRAWRSLSTNEDAHVGWHRDNLPPHALKIMHFRGEVNQENGALEWKDKNGDVHAFAGEDVTVIIDTNRVHHRAGGVIAEGRFRDCIELSLMPEANQSRAQASGPEAEHPFNPFRDWSKRASGIAPLSIWGKKITNRSVGV